ncbi:hypothetical protein ACO1O0_009046 [Amphichorda felina]
MVLYLVIQNGQYGDPSGGHDWADGQTATPTPSKQELKEMIQRSHDVWSHVAETTTEMRKTADTLAVMLARLGVPVDRDLSVTDVPSIPQTQNSISGTSQAFFSVPQATEVIDSMSFPGMESGGNILGTFDLGSSWISAPNNMDWPHGRGNANGPGPICMERAPPMDGMAWDTAPSQQGTE